MSAAPQAAVPGPRRQRLTPKPQRQPEEAPGTSLEMPRSTFDAFRRIVYAHCGISLSEHKMALVAARLSKRMRALGISDYRSYLRRVHEDRGGEELVELIDAISTNVTSFYREPEHFAFIQGALETWLAEGRRRFRMWSAACATGEEPYTLAATVLETCWGRDLDVRILATDISTRALERCRAGQYPESKLDKIPTPTRTRYFRRRRDGDPDGYEVRDSLRSLVTFARLNLAKPPFPMRGPFDVILCRNVMIYFDTAVRRRLMDELYRLVRPGGYVLVGHAESLTGIPSAFRSVRPSVYRRDPR